MPVICLSFMPESPRWRASKSGRVGALHSLSWIRNLPETNDYIHRKLTIMEAGAQQEIEESGEGWRHWVRLLRELSQKGVRNRIIVSMMMMMMMFQNFTGYVIFSSVIWGYLIVKIVFVF